MNEFPVWLLTVLSHSRTLFVAFLKVCEYLLSWYLLFVDYTVELVFSIFGPRQDDGFMEWVDYCLDKEAADYTDFFDIAVPYVAATVTVFLSAGYIFVIWFLSFFLPFSHLAAPSVSNEYLLLGCILFTVFFIYGRIAGVANDATAAVEPIGQDICRQASRQSAVGFYHEDSSVEYVTTLSSFDSLLANVETASELTYEADDVLFEEALTTTASNSLQSAVYEEVAMELLDVACEELEDNEIVVDDLVEELEDSVVLS